MDNVENYRDLCLKILNIRNGYYDVMLSYTPTFNSEKDARVTIFSKCINVLDSTFLSFYYFNFYLTEPDWWNELPSKLPVSLPAANDIIKHIDTYAFSTKIAFVQLLHSSIESSMRRIFEKYNLEEYCKRARSFGRIYQYFFVN